jgi:hypothetical protein
VNVIQTVGAAGGSFKDMGAGAGAVRAAFNSGGQAAAEAVLNAANAASGHGVALLNDVFSVAVNVAMNAGNGQDMTEAGTAVLQAFTRGGQAGADAATRIGEIAAGVGGTGAEVAQVATIVADQIEAEYISFGSSDASQFASQLANRVQSAAPASVADVMEEISSPFAVPPF